MDRLYFGRYFYIPWGGAGLGVLLLALLKTGGLAQGGAQGRYAVLVSLCFLAVFAALVLAIQKYPRPLIWACLFPISLALFSRVLLFDHVTQDYVRFLSQWAAIFREGGGFAALRHSIGNYNVPYLYFLAVISYIKIPDLYAIKLFSVLFDVVLAWGGLRVARTLCGEKSLRPAAAFCLLLLLPTVILNGACWGQCDSIYSALALHATASAMERRPLSSVALIAAAFSFKLQAIFLIPLWCILWYTGRVKLRHLLTFPLWCALIIAPAMALGKPFKEIVGVYAGQVGEYVESLTLNAPSVFSLLPHGARVNERAAAVAGIVAAFILVLALLAFLFSRRRFVENRTIFLSAFLLSAAVPFLLPYMHERYFFLADALALVWACTDVRRVFQAAGVQVASLGGYHAYLLERYAFPIVLPGLILPMGAEALVLLTVLISSSFILIKGVRSAGGLGK